MIERYFQLETDQRGSLQEKIRKALLDAICTGTLPVNEALPSCRRLSHQLGVSRNTVALVYESLVEDGYLISRPRSGYYLHESYHAPPFAGESSTRLDEPEHAPNWHRRFSHRPSHFEGVLRPSNWMDYRYPFIYGQRDAQRFPLGQWREASRQLLEERRDRQWLNDRYDQDDPALIEQLRTRVLPKRGILADADEILITLGSQNALFLVTQLLFTGATRVAMENPGYREAASVFARQGAQLVGCPVDAEGLTLEAATHDCDYLYVTPSHQVPSGVPMSRARRRALLDQAVQRDQIVIEDDYDAETNIERDALPALKSDQRGHRVIYLSSFSKSLSAGLRLGYLVADAELIFELRALRRLMYRHPPSSLQRQLAQFLAQGHYDRALRLQQQSSRQRWELLDGALRRHLPDCRRISGDHASAFWIATPEACDTQRLAWRASQSGILIEPGFQHFFDQVPPRNFMRLGFDAIDVERIEPGIELLSRIFNGE
ncbi:PLP-dependent aminotransferase family protein [Halotalea alkalilenta]|uniref:MocR-like pyridoxine biosynthesis transcription factor PdxR n=1 Tax=Halotalea alkalilenta TaxID=376489 RepID=UPI000485E4F5|nr:PLP-dependent aminotransferase family protein [Halotalea alkalilenta]